MYKTMDDDITLDIIPFSSGFNGGFNAILGGLVVDSDDDSDEKYSKVKKINNNKIRDVSSEDDEEIDKIVEQADKMSDVGVIEENEDNESDAETTTSESDIDEESSKDKPLISIDDEETISIASETDEQNKDIASETDEQNKDIENETEEQNKDIEKEMNSATILQEVIKQVDEKRSADIKESIIETVDEDANILREENPDIKQAEENYEIQQRKKKSFKKGGDATEEQIAVIDNKIAIIEEKITELQGTPSHREHENGNQESSLIEYDGQFDEPIVETDEPTYESTNEPIVETDEPTYESTNEPIVETYESTNEPIQEQPEQFTSTLVGGDESNELIGDLEEVESVMQRDKVTETNKSESKINTNVEDNVSIDDIIGGADDSTWQEALANYLTE